MFDEDDESPKAQGVGHQRYHRGRPSRMVKVLEYLWFEIKGTSTDPGPPIEIETRAGPRIYAPPPKITVYRKGGLLCAIIGKINETMARLEKAEAEEGRREIEQHMEELEQQLIEMHERLTAMRASGQQLN